MLLAQAVGAEAAVQDLSLLGMFMSAKLVVKLVMLGLLGASIWCWAIIIQKWILYRQIRSADEQFEEVFWSGQSLDELYNRLSGQEAHGMGALFVAAMREWKRSVQNTGTSFVGMQQRIEKVLDVTIARETERLESALLVLASTASAGPFVGLFGTVWGIMTAFTSIAASKNTSLAVVAPGIAEALFATATGLFAAIPALVFYNVLQSRVAQMRAQFEAFADEFSAILSRQIDQHMSNKRSDRPA